MKKSIVMLTAACLALSAQAQQRSESEMQAIAAQHLYGQPSPLTSHHSPVASKPEKLMQNDMVAAYGDRYNGTVFVSRDAMFAPVLGYTDRPLSMESLPDGLQWWMQTISATMQQKIQDNDLRTIQKAQAQDVEPMVTTRWAQDTPYNDLCPVVDSWSKRRAQTGCVATAMAQIMNFHQYPTEGHGMGYYTMLGSSSKKNVRIKGVYDWPNMKETYAPTADKDATTDAVATLMYDCGLASHMAYAQQGSGATSPDAAAGLAHHFDYDSLALHCTFRALDNTDRWMQTIYDELKAGRPVEYLSTDANYGAHAFVIDGCRASDGYLHVNWGWNGDADGYFDFFNLNPQTDMQAAYGKQGFNFSSEVASQSMLTGIMPPDGEEKPYISYWAMADEETIEVTDNSIIVHLPTIFNYHFLAFKGLVGLCIENVATGHSPIQPFYYSEWNGYEPVPPLAGWEAMDLTYGENVINGLEDGDYDLYLMSWYLTDIGKFDPQYIRFPDLDDGNENYNKWRMTKRDGHLTIEKTKVPLTQEEAPTALSPASVVSSAIPSRSTYDLQGRIANGHSSNVIINNGKKYINK